MSKRILWLSNAPSTKTGYGVQSTIVYDLRDKLGYEIIGQAFYGVQGAPININGITWLPSVKEAYGNDMLELNYRATESDMVISLVDAWVMHPEVTSRVRWIPYMPVDCHPLPPPIIKSIRTAYRIISYSKFGQAELGKAGFPSYYIPHFVDSRDFYPLTEAEKNAFREAQNIPEDAFVVAIVAANKGAPSRKAFDAQLGAIGAFMKNHPNTHILLHTDVWGGYNGEPIDYLLQFAGVPLEKVHIPQAFQFHNGLYGQDYMNALYNAADVTMNMTRGEGFGVPIIESAAAGTPVIVTEHSAMTELGNKSNGWVVKPDAEVFMSLGMFAVPSIKRAAEALEEVFKAKADGSLAERASKGREAILAEYERQFVVENHWASVLSEISDSIDEREQFMKKVGDAREK